MSALSKEELELFGPMTAPTAPSKPKITITDIPDEPAKVAALFEPRPTAVQSPGLPSDEPAAVLPPDAPQNDAAATPPEKKRGRPAGAKNKPKDIEQTTALMVETAKETGVTFDIAAIKSLEAQVHDTIQAPPSPAFVETFERAMTAGLGVPPKITIEFGTETLAALRKIFGV